MRRSGGGKALHIAEKLYVKERQYNEKEPAGDAIIGESAHLRGHVEARDLTEYKTDLIRENIVRSGLPNISAVCRDASVPDPAAVGTADIVIADLPCSGLGVLGRKTDLKYKASAGGNKKPREAAEKDPKLREGICETWWCADLQHMYCESGGEY